MPTVPLELADLIVSFLHPIPLTHGHGYDIKNDMDKSTATQVAKCALVCRAWVPLSRRILFYRTHVTQDTAHRFAKLFQRHQRLTFLPFIRELEFRGILVLHSWMGTVFPKIAQHLPSSIRTLVYAAHWGGGWKPRLVSPPHLSGITRFELIGTWHLNLSEALKCIASFPALEELKVWFTSQGWEDTALPEPSVRPAHTLRSLNFKGLATEPLFGWIQASPAVVSELRLCFSTVFASVEFVQSAARYIQDLGPSLISLSLIFEVENPYYDLEDEFSHNFLKHNIGLRALYIEATPRQTLALLRKASLSPPLEFIRIAIKSPASPIPDSVWSHIDRMVEPIQSVRKLEIVHPPPACGELVSAAFSLCAARGISIRDVEVESL
ncbi:hypothetical protein K438DRAFT_2012164 [Mycena galopus ATCC 62051]|nr:hypothetical protein K438DRAFT_2012164 [Mycena galopus ATCC 62051]